MAMSKVLVRRAVYLFAAAALCVLFLPRTATADSTDIVTLSFAGCDLASCATPNITGTYAFDPDTDSVGAFSFTTPSGTFFGDCTGLPSTDCTATPGSQGYLGDFQLLDFADDNQYLQLAFAGSQGFQGTIITSALNAPPLTGSDNPSMLSEFDSAGDVVGLFNLTSGSTTVIPTATPEPSTLALLGFGLFGLFIVRRKRSTRALQLTRS
jgi:PEP-CTERM motif